MKKATILFLFIFLIGNSSFVMAEKVDLRKITEIQATNPSVFIKLVTPTVTDVVKKEYGEKATWTPDQITKLSIHNDHTVKPTKRWYVVKMKIFVPSPDTGKKHADLVILKIETKADLVKVTPNEEVSDATVKLLEYVHDFK